MSRNENGQLEPGTLLAGRYSIERFLAGGGMGLVYIAQDQRLANRRCAIKEIFDRFTNTEERERAIEYFHREADTLAQLKHPAIPAIVDRFGEGNCHYLVMDFIEGTNLEDELAAHGGPLPESRVVEIARQLSEVFFYLHSFHPPVIYRDMKPGNVILTPEGHVVLIDFGIARIFTPQGKATLIGTPGFAPPEQYSGAVDERSDIYSLAATLHYLLTGRDPEKNAPFSFPLVHSLKPEASPFLAQALDRALEYKPEDRPASADAFKEMFLYGRGLDTARQQHNTAKAATQDLEFINPQAVEPVGSLPRPKRYWGWKIGTLLLLLLMTGSAYGLYTHPQLLGTNVLASVGETIPWKRIEAVLPQWGQHRLRRFVANLPWEREKVLRKLRADPVEVVALKILNTSRDGTPLSDPKAKYTADEVQYLTWEAELKNRLAGQEGAEYRLEGRFFDPEGGLAGKSEAGRYVRPEEERVALQSVTLLEGLKERAKGEYQFELYLNNKKLTGETILIEAEPKKVAKTTSLPREETVVDAPLRPTPPPPVPAAVVEERKRQAAEAKRLALIREHSRKPLNLVTVRFFNTTKDGKRLSSPSESFTASQLRFVTWSAVFRNRLQGLAPAYHRVEATYYAPNGRPLGTVQDAKEVSSESGEISFTGRIGNSTGGAFVPGTYRVDFYVNGWPLSSAQFIVNEDRNLAPVLRHHSGSILGLVSGREVPIDIRFDAQDGGRLRGEIDIRATGYGRTSLDGRINGLHLEFEIRIGRKRYQFRGWREEDLLRGTYKVSGTGESGHWSVRITDGTLS